jgi:hypothetical protein
MVGSSCRRFAERQPLLGLLVLMLVTRQGLPCASRAESLNVCLEISVFGRMLELRPVLICHYSAAVWCVLDYAALLLLLLLLLHRCNRSLIRPACSAACQSLAIAVGCLSYIAAAYHCCCAGAMAKIICLSAVPAASHLQ